MKENVEPLLITKDLENNQMVKKSSLFKLCHTIIGYTH